MAGLDLLSAHAAGWVLLALAVIAWLLALVDLYNGNGSRTWIAIYLAFALVALSLMVYDHDLPLV